MNIRAVLFDMDGVLVDSKPYHLHGMKELFKRHGITLSPPELENIFGIVDERNIHAICNARKIPCNAHAMGTEKRNIVVSSFKHARLHSFPGALELVKRARRTYKVGLATSSNKNERGAVLKQLKLTRAFDCILGREDVKTHKPSPEVYQKLARKLGVRPSQCIVIEDSVAGVEAAKRAGMFCIAVTNSYPASKLKKARMIVKRLDDKKIQRLLKC